MDYFTEQAPTHDECLRKIQKIHGDRAIVMTQRTVRVGGILGLFAHDEVEMQGYVPKDFVMNAAGKISYQGIGSSGGESRLAGPAGGGLSGLPPGGGGISLSRSNVLREPDPYKEPASRSVPLDFAAERQKILAATGNATLPPILQELKDIKEKIGAISAAASPAPEDPPNISRLEELLVLNDFSAAYRARLLERVRKECSLETLNDFDALQDKALEWIGETISIYKEKAPLSLPRIMILVGPTGVGKTTTIAKLAAIFGLSNSEERPLSVRMITIDALRIGARAQIEAYGGIMDIPVSYVDNREDLRKELALYSEGVDMVLIDTFGKSPRDAVKLGEMKHILDACGSQAELHLAMAAATKSGDLVEILRQFEPFNYRSVIITKLDETGGMGNVISALAERGKSVSYITDGQTVPSDIQRANVVHFLTNLEGFKVNRQKIEERFPVNKSDQNQWR